MDILLERMVNAQSKLQDFNDRINLVVKSINYDYELLSEKDRALLKDIPVEEVVGTLTQYSNITSNQVDQYLSDNIMLLKLFLYD